MTTYYFTRHGESQANVDRVFAGWMDSPLTAKGRQEANEEGTRLAREGTIFDLIMSSPLSRAHDTATIIAEALDYPTAAIITLEELKERSVGGYEGRPNDSLNGQPRHVDAIGEAGGEAREAFARRVSKALAVIRTESVGKQNVLIVAHAGWYKMAKCLIEQKSTEEFYLLQSPENNKVVPFPL
jgi:probable phosphoglycerate mutase